jgi:hypothetical protein
MRISVEATDTRKAVVAVRVRLNKLGAATATLTFPVPPWPAICSAFSVILETSCTDFLISRSLISTWRNMPGALSIHSFAGWVSDATP